tara:strand:- start:56821 stop:57150 length:330 start_codon:yes stop_codon:yes gene_type:complete
MKDKTILFIYDDSDARDLAMQSIRRSGYRAVGAATLQEALIKAYACNPDLILAEGHQSADLWEFFQRDPAVANTPILLVRDLMQSVKSESIESFFSDFNLGKELKHILK